jgi:filamin
LLTGALDDGKILWYLLTSISGKTLPKINPNPKFRIHKLENISVSLKFLEEEKIKLIGIAQESMSDSAYYSTFSCILL